MTTDTENSMTTGRPQPVRCANCGDEAPTEITTVPRGMVWLCGPCDHEVELALET